MTRKKVLIISYIFPPHPGIGGRRWAKFAKYLSRFNYEVHVVYARNPNGGKSVWLNDVEGNSNIIMHEVNAFFPKAFTHPPRHLADRIIYKFWQLIAGIQIKGYIYDRTVFSGRRFVEVAERLIREKGISDVIVTGAPFRLVYLVAKASRNWKNIHLIADFRDPWTWENGGDYQKLSPADLKHEVEREEFVMKTADKISVPTKNMMQHLRERYSSYAEKVMLLPHAWDEDEIKREIKVKNAVLRIVMFGTLYSGIDDSIRELANALKETKGKVHLDIISDSNKYINIFKECNALQCVTYLAMMPSVKLYKSMKNYYASVIINNDSDKDHVSTKFIELAASGTPVIYIASPGKAGQFVQNKNLGWHIQPSQIRKLFNHLIAGNFKHPVPTLNVNSLSFREVTKQFIKNLSGNEQRIPAAKEKAKEIV